MASADEACESLGKVEPIRLVYDVKPNPPRYLGVGDRIDWEKPGLTLELLQLVGERLKITFNYERVPWKRGLERLKKGSADGIFHASFKKERQAFSVYPMNGGAVDESRQIFTQSYVLYTRRDSALAWDGKRFDNLNLPIGATLGYSIADDLRRMDVQVEEAHSHETNFNKVLSGRLAAYAQLENMADVFLKRHNGRYVDIVKLEPPLKRKPYYLIFSHQFADAHAELAECIWDTIAAVQKEPAFEALIDRYNQ